jgi:hypothetical protein
LDGFGVYSIEVELLRVGSLAVLRQARGQERQQLKGFVFAALMVDGFVPSLVWQEGGANSVAWFAFVFAIMVPPLTTAIAILKYRFYDIDRFINRTLVYGLLTVKLALLYFCSSRACSWRGSS